MRFSLYNPRPNTFSSYYHDDDTIYMFIFMFGIVIYVFSKYEHPYFCIHLLNLMTTD